MVNIFSGIKKRFSKGKLSLTKANTIQDARNNAIVGQRSNSTKPRTRGKKAARNASKERVFLEIKGLTVKLAKANETVESAAVRELSMRTAVGDGVTTTEWEQAVQESKEARRKRDKVLSLLQAACKEMQNA